MLRYVELTLKPLFMRACAYVCVFISIHAGTSATTTRLSNTYAFLRNLRVTVVFTYYDLVYFSEILLSTLAVSAHEFFAVHTYIQVHICFYFIAF